MTRRIAKTFAAAAVALSLLLVVDSIQGLARPQVEIAASLGAGSR